MMIAMQTILAEGGGSFRIVGLVILAVIWIIGGIVKKAAEQKEQRERAAKDARHRGEAPKSAGERSDDKARWVQPAKRPPVTRQVQRPAPAPTPPQIKVSDQVGTSSLGESQSRRIERDTRQRLRRLSSRKVPEADTADIDARLGRLKHQDEHIVEVAAAMAGLDLGSADALKRAIIYQEILSPPKAMRKEQGLWEQ